MLKHFESIVQPHISGCLVKF